MPQQPLALNDNDIPAYNVTDDMLFGDGIGDAMLNFEEMFDDTNMFDWVRNFLSFFFFPSFYYSFPFWFLSVNLTLRPFISSTNRVLSTSIFSLTPDPGDNSSPIPACSPHFYPKNS